MINYDSADDLHDDLKKCIQFTSCLSLLSTLFYLEYENCVKTAKIHLAGANVNAIILNTALFGGITFGILKSLSKKNIIQEFSNAKLALMSFLPIFVGAAVFSISISAILYNARREKNENNERFDNTNKEKALIETAYDISFTHPLGLVANSVVAIVGICLGRDD